MTFTLKKLFAMVSLACVAAFLVLVWQRDPARRLNYLGASYEPQKKNGKMIFAWDFDDDRLPQIVSAINDLRVPRTLYLTGTQISDNGFGNLADSTNLTAIWITDLKITDNALSRLAKIDVLEKIVIKNCPNITSDGVATLRKQSPELHIKLE